MVSRADLVRYVDDLLAVDRIRDYSPNGLQVEGRDRIERLITGVTASQAFLEQAIDAGADAVLVHHGYFWKNEDARVVGMKARRLRTLLRADVNLLAYHLPLDVHPEYGNNRQLGNLLGATIKGEIDTGMQPSVGVRGALPSPLSAAEFGDRLATLLGRVPLRVGPDSGMIRTLAWCTGAGQDFIEAAAAAGVDAYLSGEISERTTHSARELGIHYYAIGHHASERYGVQALGDHLAAHFGLEHRFIDDDNPV